jgi:hypothetical protein
MTYPLNDDRPVISVIISDPYGFPRRRDDAKHRVTFRIADSGYLTLALTTGELEELSDKLIDRLDQVQSRTQQPLVERM